MIQTPACSRSASRPWTTSREMAEAWSPTSPEAQSYVAETQQSRPAPPRGMRKSGPPAAAGSFALHRSDGRGTARLLALSMGIAGSRSCDLCGDRGGGLHDDSTGCWNAVETASRINPKPAAQKAKTFRRPRHVGKSEPARRGHGHCPATGSDPEATTALKPTNSAKKAECHPRYGAGGAARLRRPCFESFRSAAAHADEARLYVWRQGRPVQPPSRYRQDFNTATYDRSRRIHSCPRQLRFRRSRSTWTHGFMRENVRRFINSGVAATGKTRVLRRGDDQLLHLPSPRAGRRQAVRRRCRCDSLPVGSEPSAPADRIERTRSDGNGSARRATSFFSSMSRAR